MTPFDDQRRGFLAAAAGADVERPGRRQLADVAGVDVGQRAEARLGLVQPVGQPVVARAGLAQRAVVDLRGLLRTDN